MANGICGEISRVSITIVGGDEIPKTVTLDFRGVHGNSVNAAKAVLEIQKIVDYINKINSGHHEKG